MFLATFKQCGLHLVLCLLLASTTIHSNHTYAQETAYQDTVIFAMYMPVRNTFVGRKKIIEYIFNRADFDVSYLPIPPKRMPQALQSETVDTFYSAEMNNFSRDNFIRAKYPLTIVKFSAYFHQSNSWRPTWPPNESFREAKGVTVNLSFLENKEGMRLSRVGDFRAGIKMVNANRASYFFDAIFTSDPGVANIYKQADEGYLIEEVFVEPLFLFFLNSEKGRQLQEAWDKGMETLMQDQLKMDEIFYQIEPPDIEILVYDRFKKYIAEHQM